MSNEATSWPYPTSLEILYVISQGESWEDISGNAYWLAPDCLDKRAYLVRGRWKDTVVEIVLVEIDAGLGMVIYDAVS